MKQPIYNTALYLRLSRDDEQQGDSGSIQTQSMMLRDYAQTHGLNVVSEYVDDGWSGTNYDRPGFQKMIDDIEDGKINCVVTKNLSRLGRNYIMTGQYTEVLFREKGVRFITISNGVDSANRSTEEFAPFINIMSEWYIRDCSRKVTTVLRARGMSGKHTTNHAVYGYRKDPSDPSHWVIDEEAAEVVRRIFRLTIEGNGPYQIAHMLADEQVERPSYYLAQRGQGTHQANIDESFPYAWRGATVAAILERPEYMGHTVNFRSYKESYKDKRAIKRPPEEWMIFEHTHEAIVDPKTWKLAQQIRKTVKRTDTTGMANPLTGLVFCADCGSKMYNHRKKSFSEKEG